MALRSLGMPRDAEYRWLRGFVDGLGQLVDGHVGRGQVRVPEPEVDDVASAPPRCRLQVVDGGEHVRRQPVDAAELHR